MKKAILTVLFLTAGVCVFAQNGVIKDLTGTVELKPAGSVAFVPATAGAKVNADTVISTGFKSTAIVEVGSALIAVRPLTRLTLTEISASEGGEKVNMSLQAGRVHVDVKPAAGSKAAFMATSPTSTASVRGTSFYLDVKSVRVSEGTVVFKGNTGYTVQVSAGSFSAVDSNGMARESQSISGEGLVLPYPYGYNPNTMETTGGSGRNSGGGGSSDSDDASVDVQFK